MTSFDIRSLQESEWQNLLSIFMLRGCTLLKTSATSEENSGS